MEDWLWNLDYRPINKNLWSKCQDDPYGTLWVIGTEKANKMEKKQGGFDNTEVLFYCDYEGLDEKGNLVCSVMK